MKSAIKYCASILAVAVVLSFAACQSNSSTTNEAPAKPAAKTEAPNKPAPKAHDHSGHNHDHSGHNHGHDHSGHNHSHDHSGHNHSHDHDHN